MSTSSNSRPRMAQADQDPQEFKRTFDEAIDLFQSLQVSLNDVPQFSYTNSRIVQVANLILKRDYANLRRQVKAGSDILHSMQDSIKKAYFTDDMRSTTTYNLRLIKYRLDYLMRLLKRRHKLFNFVFKIPDTSSENNNSSFTILDAYGTLGRTNHFLLDMFLPPDRAEDTSTALQDVCEGRWKKRYAQRTVVFICFAHIVSAICAHHAVRLGKLGGFVLGIAQLKKVFSKFWGA